MANAVKVHHHLHLGTGSLALGFVIPLVHTNGNIETLLVNRKSDKAYHRHLKNQRKYDLRYFDSPGEPDVPCKGLALLFDEGEEAKEARNSLVSEDFFLVTTAITPDGFPFAADFLADALEKRRMHNPRGDWKKLYIIACENLLSASTSLKNYLLQRTTSSGSPQLAEYIVENVVFLDAVVDRICSKVNFDKARDCVVVSAEKYADWAVCTEVDPGFRTGG